MNKAVLRRRVAREREMYDFKEVSVAPQRPWTLIGYFRNLEYYLLLTVVHEPRLPLRQ